MGGRLLRLDGGKGGLQSAWTRSKLAGSMLLVPILAPSLPKLMGRARLKLDNKSHANQGLALSVQQDSTCSSACPSSRDRTGPASQEARPRCSLTTCLDRKSRCCLGQSVFGQDSGRPAAHAQCLFMRVPSSGGGSIKSICSCYLYTLEPLSSSVLNLAPPPPS